MTRPSKKSMLEKIDCNDELARLRQQMLELHVEMDALQQDRAALIELSEDHARALQAMRVAREDLDTYNEELESSRDNFRELQLRFERLFRLAPFAYLMLDGKGIITDCNRLAANFFAHDPAYLVDKPISRFIAKSQHELLLDFYAKWKNP